MTVLETSNNKAEIVKILKILKLMLVIKTSL